VSFVFVFVLRAAESWSPAPRRCTRSPSVAPEPHRRPGSLPLSSRARAHHPSEDPAANGAPQLLIPVVLPLDAVAPPRLASSPVMRCWQPQVHDQSRPMAIRGPDRITSSSQGCLYRSIAARACIRSRLLDLDPMDQIHPFSVPAHFCLRNPEFFQIHNPVLPP
jgi:hypothetical protein